METICIKMLHNQIELRIKKIEGLLKENIKTAKESK